MSFIATGHDAHPGGGRHPVGPLREWIENYARRHHIDDMQQLAFELDVCDRTLRRWRDGGAQWVSGNVVDRIFTHLGTPDVYWELYPMMEEEAMAARKGACVNGHPYTRATTYRDPRRGRRQCRVCRAQAMARFRARAVA